MDKLKITNHQLFSLTANGCIGGSVIVIASTITSIAGRDGWMAGIFTTVLGLPVIWMYWFLGSQYPDMTFISIINKIFGKWIGFVVAGGYVFLCLQIAYHIPWYIGNFMTSQVVPETPMYVVNLLFLAAVVIALLYGIETIARASELFLYFSSGMLIIAMVLVLPNAKIENLQPVLEKGIAPVLRSSIFLSSYSVFSLVVLMMVFPVHIDNVLKARNPIFKGYLWGNLITFITILISILVLGSTITSKSTYPIYLLAKEIDVGIVFTRLEFIVMVSWIVTQLVIEILFFYAGVTGLAQLIGLKDYKRIVIPLGLIMLVLSGVVFPDVMYQANWINLAWTPQTITNGLVIPLVMVVVFSIKKWIFKKI